MLYDSYFTFPGIAVSMVTNAHAGGSFVRGR